MPDKIYLIAFKSPLFQSIILKEEKEHKDLYVDIVFVYGLLSISHSFGFAGGH